MLEWIKRSGGGSDHPMRNPSAAKRLLAELRTNDPVTALGELGGWLESLDQAPGFDEQVRSEILALIQQAGAAHVSALLTHHLTQLTDGPVLREAKWKALFDYATVLSEVLCGSGERLIAAARHDAGAGGASAAGAVRGLHGCRSLTKICLVHYLSVPSKLWRLAYSLYASAEMAGCAGSAVHPHPGDKTTTTATQELLRLLMLQASVPEMLAPEHIEIVDRITEQLGNDFTLRAAGATDSHFRFDPDGDLPPQRALEQNREVAKSTRYFGPGSALEALARLHKQLAASGASEVKAFGPDITATAKLTAIEHLLVFWGPKPGYSPPPHAPASGDLLIVHQYAQLCAHIPDAESTIKGSTAFGIANAEPTKPQTPETWSLRDAGGTELGAEIPQLNGSWARCGQLVGVSVVGSDRWWVGVIRRMHADLGRRVHADIAVFSRQPLAIKLRTAGSNSEDAADWETSSDSLSYHYVTAVLLPDISQATGKLNLLLPAEGWKAGQVYEAMLGEAPRYLRVSQLLRRGEDYARAAFEWMPAPNR